MGLFRKSSWCRYSTPPMAQPRPAGIAPPLPNPNPRSFRLLRVRQIGDFVVVKIRYPDCTNYEGTKILVFEGVTTKRVRSWKIIDPHFCDGNHVSPVARFEPSERGWARARRFCRAESKPQRKNT